MRRRAFLLAGAALAMGCRKAPHAPLARDRRLAITIDDPSTEQAPVYGARERNRAISAQLAARRVQVMLFVCGKRIDSAAGAGLLAAFHEAGHLLRSRRSRMPSSPCSPRRSRPARAWCGRSRTATPA